MNKNGIIRVSLVLFSLGIGFLLFGFLFVTSLALPAQAADGIHYVAPGGACGSAISPCYSSVQAAVDATGEGEEIRVAAGTYTDIHARQDVTQVVYLSKTVSIRGGYTTSDWNSPDPDVNPTTLDAQGQGRVLYITGDISPTIAGLRFTGGDASGLGGFFNGEDSGGGIFISDSSAIIENCVVFGNTAYYGGGVHANNSAAIMQGNIITGNNATNKGGGLSILFSTARLSANSISSNTASNGGSGAYLYWDSSTLENNTFSNNVTLFGMGGGLYLQGGTGLLNANLIDSNHAWEGGGIFAVNTTTKFFSNKIISNVTANEGAGVDLSYGSPVLVNNVIANNHITGSYSGSALWVWQTSPDMVHNTIINNTSSNGAAIQFFNLPGDEFSHLEMTNTIMISQAIGISVTGGNTITLNGILWFDTPITISQAITASVAVQNQWDGDPLFDLDGYHLTSGSIARDKGVSTNFLTDIDNQQRIPAPDLGADEYWLPGFPKYIYLPIIIR
jgi:parallel beta-helix repeat protein